MTSFYLLVHDVRAALRLNQDDCVLDAGGGAGDLAVVISPLVRQVTLFDAAADVVAKARDNTAAFPNITVLQDDIIAMRQITGIFDKAIVGSVLQYLGGYPDIEAVLANLYRCLKPGGRVLFTHNPDLAKKAAHIASYGRLDWDQQRLSNALALEEKRFWIDKERFADLSQKIGFTESSVAPINPELWQSTHMFDWLLVK